MSLEDDVRTNGYVRAALISNNDAELERNMRIADNAADMAGNLLNGIGRALSEPSPPPPPKTSSGGGLGGLLVLGAIAGGAYLLNKVFSGDDKKNNNSVQSSNSNKSKYPETEW